MGWPEGETVEEWKMLMGQEGTMGDQVVLQVAANFFQRQIVILPVFWSAAHLPSLGITLISPSSKSPPKTSSSRSALFLQYFSESRFLTPHYQSVRPKPGENHLVESLQRSLVGDGKAPKDEEEEEFLTQLKDLPDPPCTPMRNLRSSLFTPSPTTPSSSPTPPLPFLQMCLLRPPPPSPCRPPPRPCRPPPPRPPPPPCPTPPVPSSCIFWKGKSGG